MQITNQTMRSRIGVGEPHRLVRAGGTRVAVSSVGAGMPVLCLHAIAHGGRDFEPFAHRIAGPDFAILQVDWPGHGKSPADETGAAASARRYAMIAVQLIEALMHDGTLAEPPVIIGNSIGGAAAILAASKRPDCVRALVLSNPGGLTAVDPFTRRFCLAMARFFAAGARGAAWFPTIFDLYYKLVLPRPAAHEQRRRIVAAGGETAAILSEAWTSFASPDADIRAELINLKMPVLFAWARQDRIVSWQRNRACVERSGSPYVLLQGGHSPFLEDLDGFTSVFLEFIRALNAQNNF